MNKSLLALLVAAFVASALLNVEASTLGLATKSKAVELSLDGLEFNYDNTDYTGQDDELAAASEDTNKKAKKKGKKKKKKQDTENK